MSIALIHSGKSFMPEIGAYQNYFDNNGIPAVSLINPSQSEMQPYDILWFFMGIQYPLDKINKKKIIVHEYCSASTPPLARLKDLIKKSVNPTPALRITLNAEHRGTVFPTDNIPMITRKQGVNSCFFENTDHIKEYDFIYTGSAQKMRASDKWLLAFTNKFPDMRIILIGNHEPEITKQFRSNANIHFKGPVPIELLPSLLASARYAVNYVPDIYPFNIQPSTKLLEYCAAGCKIVSNEYNWIKEFSQSANAGILFIDDQFDKLSTKNLEQFHFTVPDMCEYKWENIFNKMQLQQYLPI